MSQPELSPLALALGRIPTGLYIVSAREGPRPIGFVGSFVMQVGLEPPVVCVAVGRSRGPLEALRAGKHFGLSVLDPQSGGLMKHFFKKPTEGASVWDGLAHSEAPGGSPVLDDALAWLECLVCGEHALADHVVLFGEVVAGELRRAGDPSIHLRKSGLGY